MESCSQQGGGSPGTGTGNRPEAPGETLDIYEVSRPSPSPSPESTGVLPAVRVGALEGMPTEERWLIEDVWLKSAAGFVAAAPKLGKTFLSLELAVAVASGAPALGRYAVPEPGTVLFFPAEDDPRAARDRVASIAAKRGVPLDELPLFIITLDQLHIDEENDRAVLEQMLEHHRPKLLVLDPLVRIHSGDENYSGHISELLGYLRSLERRFGTAIIVTHHIAKSSGRRGGQALRGSGDLHAWADSSLYLERHKDGRIEMSFEHRSAPTPSSVELVLTNTEGGAYFEVFDFEPSAIAEGQVDVGRAQSRAGESLAAATELPLAERVLELLRASDEPLSQVALRKTLRVKNSRLTAALRELSGTETIERAGVLSGWQLKESEAAP